MKNNKAPGPSGITAEMLEARGKFIKWLQVILNNFSQQVNLQDDRKESENCNNIQTKKLCIGMWELQGFRAAGICHVRVTERQITERVHIHDNPFGFMSGTRTMDAILY